MKKAIFLIVLAGFCFVSLTGGYAQEIPNSPSDVYVDQNTNILMVKKPVDNNYRRFVIKGINWSPATKAPHNELIGSKIVDFGFFFDWSGRIPQGHELLEYWLREELINHYSTDIPLIKEVNANTIRLYSCNLGYGEDDGNYTYEIKTILDECYRNNIMVIMTIAISKEDLDSRRHLDRVGCYKDHPAILMWAIGNEWNLNKFYDSGWGLEDAAKAVNQTAKEIRAIDPHHPICSILSDKVSSFLAILTNCPDIDLWGVNVYRGNSFGNFFEQWKKQWQNLNKPAKPVFISEFGIDSFYTKTCSVVNNSSGGLLQADNVIGEENQQRQADIDISLWQEIKNNLSTINGNGLCLGGLIFEFNDELWKVGNYHVGLGGLVSYSTSPENHSYDDYNNEGFILTETESIDNTKPISEDIYPILNEEHCGLVTADRIPKQAYTRIKEAWKILSPKPPIVRDDGNYVIKNTYGGVQLEFHWSIAEGDVVDEFQYRITEGNREGTVISDWNFVGLSDWVIAGVPISDGKTYYCSVKAINKEGEAIGYSDGITVDITKPTGTIKIIEITNYLKYPSLSTDVTIAKLALNAQDAISGMGKGAQMCFSNDGSNWSTPETYSTTKAWGLSAGSGKKTVYVKFKDVAGNWSEPVSDTTVIITPDKTPPQITHAPITYAPRYSDIIFTADVIDSESGVEDVSLYWHKEIITIRIWRWRWILWGVKQRVTMAHQGNNTYKVTLYTNQTKSDDIKYHIAATDKAGNVKYTNTYRISR